LDKFKINLSLWNNVLLCLKNYNVAGRASDKTCYIRPKGRRETEQRWKGTEQRVERERLSRGGEGLSRRWRGTEQRVERET